MTFINRKLSDEDIQAIWKEMDAFASGAVSVEELLAAIREEKVGSWWGSSGPRALDKRGNKGDESAPR